MGIHKIVINIINKFFQSSPDRRNTVTKKWITLSRLYYSFKEWCLNIIKNFVANSSLLFSLLIFISYLFAYFIVAKPLYIDIPNEIQGPIYSFFEIIGLEGFGDSTVKNIISTTTRSLGFILSVLSAIYVFTHREQKSVAPSAAINSSKNSLVIIVVSTVISTMLMGATLVNNFDLLINRENYTNSLYITKVLAPKILLWVVGLICSIQLFIELIKYLFRTMSIDKMLKTSIKFTSEDVDSITKLYRHSRFKLLLMKRYNALHYNIESVFQNLKYAADNNMNKEFEQSVNELLTVIHKLKRENENLHIPNVATYLLQQDRDQFIDVYNSLLRNALSLINHLYKNQHYNKGTRLVSLYFSIYIDGEESLRRYFMISLNEFLDSIDTNNDRQIRAFLDELNVIAAAQTLIIYKNLIMRLIVQNNVKMLTTIVYDFKNHILEGKSSASRKGNRFFAAATRVYLKSSMVLILMQSLVKSVEISHYSSTGFLVKYLVTNFDGFDLNRGFSLLKKHPTSFTRIFEQDETLDKMSDDDKDPESLAIGINKETFDYCCKKLCILVYGQQLFAIRNNLWFVNDYEEYNDLIEIEQEFRTCTFSSYMLKKVESATKQYGLLFLSDEEVMQEIYEVLEVPYKKKKEMAK